MYVKYSYVCVLFYSFDDCPYESMQSILLYKCYHVEVYLEKYIEK